MVDILQTKTTQPVGLPAPIVEETELLRVVGDVHGKYHKYLGLLATFEGDSIQVGDFGFKKEHDWFLSNMNYDKHKIVFGNHDYYPLVYSPHSLGDWNYWNNIFTVRGAWSIDFVHRLEGRDWFREEQLTYRQGDEVLEAYEKIKPKYVVTHECPQKIKHDWFGYNNRTITNQLLQAMLDIHQPDLWIFGHYHKSRQDLEGNTFFKCLAELEYYDFRPI